MRMCDRWYRVGRACQYLGGTLRARESLRNMPGMGAPTTGEPVALLQRRFDLIVSQIYDSVEDVGRFPLAMRSICEDIDALAAQFLIQDGTGRYIYSQMAQPEFEGLGQQYGAHFHTVDPRIPWYSSGPVGTWQADHDRLSDAEISRSEFYSDYVHKNGAGASVNASVMRAPNHSEFVSFLRSRDAGRFTLAQREALATLTPHLTRAATLRYRLAQTQLKATMQQVELAQVPFGLLWVGADLRIITLNEKAQAVLDANDALRVSGQRLVAWAASDASRLDKALHAALASDRREGCWLALRRHREPLPLIVSVIPVVLPPVTGVSLHAGPYALLILQDGQLHARSSLGPLQLAFGLTPAELKLAEALMDNASIDSHAEQTGVSRNTVRTHLAHLFAKTGTTRQSQLVRLLMMARPVRGR